MVKPGKVRIINGEIVHENDPRPRTSNAPRNTSSFQPAAPLHASGTLNVLEMQSDIFAKTGQASNSPIITGTGNPLDPLAQFLKIDQMFVTIPAVQPLQLTESRIPLIYVILMGIITLIFGIKALVVAVILYVLYKKSNAS
jgi:hypothetical protein